MNQDMKYLIELAYGKVMGRLTVTRACALEVWKNELNKCGALEKGVSLLVKQIENGFKERLSIEESIFIFILFFYLEDVLKVCYEPKYGLHYHPLTEDKKGLLVNYLQSMDWRTPVYEIPDTFFVQIQTDTGEVFNSAKSATEIISRIDMQDCSGEQIAVFMTTAFGKVIPLEVKGCWHKMDDPLLIECVDPYGCVVISGYGTDH